VRASGYFSLSYSHRIFLAATSLLIDFQKRTSETFPRQLLDSEPNGLGKAMIEEAPEQA
jgi:hypothetical protein